MLTVVIFLQTAINDWLMRMIDRVYDRMMDFIWERGWNMRGEVLWDDMVSLSMALGAVFSLVMVGKMAYKAMVLEEGIDFMKLWKPLAMMFVMVNWYAVTYGLFALTQPVEQYFREGFLSQNATIIGLQNQRRGLTLKLDEMTRVKAAEAETGDMIEMVAMTRMSETEPQKEEDLLTEDEMNDILISNYGELFYDMEEMPTGADGEKLKKFDATTETKWVAVQNWLEKIFLWIAEAIWSCAVLVIFLVRAFFMSVLVMFGPVYMAVSILPAWEDAWKDWIEKYIGVCFLGAAAFLGLVFASHIIIYGVKVDIANWTEFTASDAAWYEWFGHVMKTFCASIGVYLTALLVGGGILGVSFELATYFFPSQMVQGASVLFQGIWNTATRKTLQVERYAEQQTRKAGQNAAGAVQAHVIAKNEDKAKASLNMGADRGPEGEMKTGRKTGEFQGRTNTYQDHQDSSPGQQKQSTYAAHRWADRLWQQKLAGSAHAAHFKTKDRMAAARQDLEEYFKAQQEGRAEEFLKQHNERMRENRILLSIVTTGRAGLHLFGGSVKERDSFLKKHGLYDAFKRAERLERNADRTDEMDLHRNLRKKKVHDAREDTAERIFGHISTTAAEILAARGIVLDFSAFEEDTVDGPDGTDIEGGNVTGGTQNTASGNKQRAWETLFDDGGSNDRVWDEAEGSGTYRLKRTDEGYENVQQQMRHSWFRKLTADRYNRMLLMHTLQAYEQALSEGRGERFIRDMQNFGAGQREGFDMDEAVHPFNNVRLQRSEYAGMWDNLRDTEKLRRINEALEAIERANEKNDKDDDNS